MGLKCACKLVISEAWLACWGRFKYAVEGREVGV